MEEITMRASISRSAFQATDLQRKHREVIDQARNSGALIRDKDGLVLLLQPAGDIERDRYVSDLMADVIRMTAALRNHPDQRSPEQYGGLAWAFALSNESQSEFVQNLSDQLLISQHSGYVETLEDLLGDWKATAQSWSDVELRKDLTKELKNPLVDVEL